MNKIKEICEKYKISHRKIAILTGFSIEHVQRVNTGKRRLTKVFERSLINLEICLENKFIEIPK